LNHQGCCSGADLGRLCSPPRHKGTKERQVEGPKCWSRGLDQRMSRWGLVLRALHFPWCLGGSLRRRGRAPVWGGLFTGSLEDAKERRVEESVVDDEQQFATRGGSLRSRGFSAGTRTGGASGTQRRLRFLFADGHCEGATCRRVRFGWWSAKGAASCRCATRPRGGRATPCFRGVLQNRRQHWVAHVDSVAGWIGALAAGGFAFGGDG
jgi:hypothetical protein